MKILKIYIALQFVFFSLTASAQNWVDGQAGAISTSNIAVFQAVTGGLIDIEGTAAPCNAENDLTLGYVKSSNTIQLCDVSLGGWQVADEYNGEQAVINATTVNSNTVNATSFSGSTASISTLNGSSINLTSGIKATKLTDANNTGYYSDPSWISRYNVFRPSYIEPQAVVTKGAGCSPNGRIAKASNGETLSCVSGSWSGGSGSGSCKLCFEYWDYTGADEYHKNCVFMNQNNTTGIVSTGDDSMDKYRFSVEC